VGRIAYDRDAVAISWDESVVESMEQLVGDHGNFSQVTGKPAEIVLGSDQLTALSEAYDRERAKSSP
jgi:hypothetical protein